MKNILIDVLWMFFIFIVETILLWKFGENIQYGIIYSLNKREKSMRNIPININYFRMSENFNGDYKYEDIISLINSHLANNNIMYDAHSTEIIINDFQYGASQLNGKIYFTYKKFDDQTILNINYEFSKSCNYNTISDEIFGLVKAIKDLEGKISVMLPEKIIYTDILCCKLSKMKLLTKLFEKFKEEKGYGYLLLPGKMKIQLSSNEIILSNEIDDIGLILLKEMITMFY